MTSILVVDDSKFMAKCMKRGLEELDFDVIGVAHDGLQGVEQYNSLQPDVMLLDVTMPNMDGLDCLIEVRKSNPDARVIMLSAIKDEDVINQCFEAGAAEYLKKPIRFTDEGDRKRLCDAIEEALTEKAEG